MRIRGIEASGPLGGIPESGWQDRFEREDCVHTSKQARVRQGLADLQRRSVCTAFPTPGGRPIASLPTSNWSLSSLIVTGWSVYMDLPGHPLETRDVLLGEPLGPDRTGFVPIPQRLGLGVETDWDAVDGY